MGLINNKLALAEMMDLKNIFKKYISKIYQQHNKSSIKMSMLYTNVGTIREVWRSLWRSTPLSSEPAVLGINHYLDVIMDAIASQITSLTIVYSIVHSGRDQRKYQSSASLAFVRGIHRWPVNSPRKWPVTRKRFPFDDVIMGGGNSECRKIMICNKTATIINTNFCYFPRK